MKFKILLWLLGFMLERASKTNSQFQHKLEDHDFILEIGCENGAHRHFIIKDKKILSYPGSARNPVYLGPSQEPTIAIIFENASSGFAILSAKDKQLAMMNGLNEKRAKIEGNPLYLLWFQSIVKLI